MKIVCKYCRMRNDVDFPCCIGCGAPFGNQKSGHDALRKLEMDASYLACNAQENFLVQYEMNSKSNWSGCVGVLLIGLLLAAIITFLWIVIGNAIM